MIALKQDRLKNAIAKARKLRPRVQYLWWRTYLVTSPNSRNQYLVKFQVTNGQQFGLCTCRAGEVNMPCYHLAAAAAVQIGVATMRRRAAQQAPASSSPSAPPRLPDHEYQSHQDAPFNLPQHSHLCPECQTSEVCTDETCEQHDGSYRPALCVACLDRRELTQQPIAA